MVPELDLTYIPPLLACDAWPPLWAGLLQPIYDRIGKKIELLANQVVSRGITFDSAGQGDRLIFAQLWELNETYAVLGIKDSASSAFTFGSRDGRAVSESPDRSTGDHSGSR